MASTASSTAPPAGADPLAQRPVGLSRRHHTRFAPVGCGFVRHRHSGNLSCTALPHGTKMPNQAKESKAERIGEVVAHLRKRLDSEDAAAFEGFVSSVYERVPVEDVMARPAAALYGAALGLWKFAERRPNGVTKVRVYNPGFTEHGWTSPHTIVDIVNDDMPFLVDSVSAEIERRELKSHLIVHPTLCVRRDAKGRRVEAATGQADSAEQMESLIHLEVDARSAPEDLQALGAAIEKVVADVRVAVEDWEPIRAALREAILALDRSPPPLPAEERGEVAAFLEWIGADHFTLLGFRDYDYRVLKSQTVPRMVAGSGLGILRDPRVHVLRGRRGLGALSAAARHFLAAPEALMVIKADVRATVHRRVHMDYIAIKKYQNGRAVGERRFIGLFTSAAYNRAPSNIPYLRRKVARTLERAEFDPVSHDGKALLNVLETFPRDELFQISEDDLLATALGILRLQERPRIRLFVRRDPFERFCSCLVYVPREAYATRLRERIQEILATAYDGTSSAYYTQLGESTLARLHIIVRTTPDRVPDPDLGRIESQIVKAARSWDEDLHDALIERWGEERGNRLRESYRGAFPAAYQETFLAREALFDIATIEELSDPTSLATNMYRPVEEAENKVRFKTYHPVDPIQLSDCLPILEHMGLKVVEERPYSVRRTGKAAVVWIQDLLLVHPTGNAFDPGPIRENFQETFAKVRAGETEDDGFNRLVFLAGLDWREVAVVRAYCKFLRQARIAFSQAYMEDTISAHPDIARLLVALFHARFDPRAEAGRESREGQLLAALETATDAVEVRDEDRIVRRYVEVIRATVRTNFYQPAADGGAKPYLSLKIDSQGLSELPPPRPFAEIFVYSPRVEAVHLRGGKVARGGIRWSDRREDFRTAVLGLMKAQMVKNAVIVPVGAKGGFVTKRLPLGGDREAVTAEGIACYQTMMRGLLDITDNIRGGKIVRPAGVVCHDDEDPYLVVAADKGTAAFSDIANSVAAEYEHWLGDAYASGGSVGYDHKAMGITARGAWESVKRHFRESGLDTQSADFTVIGVGDMSGDVFGNGMLLSEHIKLVGAFNHSHIFIDPDPDPAVSFAERRRLFEMPRSSWTDYDAGLISKGGGVFERRAKSIALSPQMKALLDADRNAMAPEALVRGLLVAAVDLLWLGGIGTYIKASTERTEDAGDRGNDAVRVSGDELRCKVIGEGANLGLTQLARIEFGANGGRINTDAIDNSAGVDCSDHEVNMKIVLDSVVAEGEMTVKQRNRLLKDMTGDVAALVLRHNYLQSQSITLAEADGPLLLDGASRMIRSMERAGSLDRALECLPDDEALAERRAEGRGLTRPEIAVLLAYSKTTLYDQLVDSDVPEDPYLSNDLERYMPARLRERFTPAIRSHRLRREIIGTFIASSIVNRAGPTFVSEIAEESGHGAGEIARAYTVTRDAFALREIWSAIEGLDNVIAAKTQTRMLAATTDLVRRSTLWFLRNVGQPLDIAATAATYAPGIASVAEKLGGMLAELDAERYEREAGELIEAGVPEPIARRVAALDPLAAACHIVHAAQTCQRPVDQVGAVYFAVGSSLGLDWLRAQAQGIAIDDHWQRLATTAIVEDLYGQQRALATRVIEAADGAVGDEAVAAWADRNRAAVQRANDLIAEFKSQGPIDIARLAIANRHVRHMIVG